jgi:hypothetical protein
MPRQFIAITQADVDVRIAESIKSREYELASYDYELAQHDAVIAELESKKLTWDETIAKYQGLSREQMLKAMARDNLSAESLAKIADLERLEYARLSKMATQFELKKSEAHYTHALINLPAERRTAAFAALTTKEAAEKAQQVKT